MVKTYHITKRKYSKKENITRVYGYRVTKGKKKGKIKKSHLILGYRGK